jgi:predicted kinase
MNKELYLLRGLPGAGKSTLAGALGGTHLEADMYHIDKNGVYDWKPEKVKDAHKWCQYYVEKAMTWDEHPEIEFISAGVSKIVVSNTFTQEWEMQPYYDLAKHYGYRVFSIIVENRHGGVNEHNVPAETLEKMKQRFEIKLI